MGFDFDGGFPMMMVVGGSHDCRCAMVVNGCRRCWTERERERKRERDRSMGREALKERERESKNKKPIE